MTVSSESSLNDEQCAEEHRAFAREIDQEFGRIYGLGGASIIGAIGFVIAMSAWLGQVVSLITALLAVTTALIMLLWVRNKARNTRERLRRRVQNYCTANQIPSGILYDYYAGQDLYPFFCSLNETCRNPMVKS